MRFKLTRVLYVVGWQRSGSTVLGNVLGSMPGVVHIGELQYLFGQNHPADFRCGCGARLPICPLWESVLKAAGIGWNDRAALNVARLDSARMRHVPGSTRRWRKDGRIPAYAEILARIYKAIAHVQPTQLIVDTSKTPGAAIAAALAPGVETYILHLVRDPRACAYSLSQRAKSHKVDQPDARMMRKSALTSSVRWTQVSWLADRYVRSVVPPSRYRVLRYEDLMASPESSLASLASWVGIDHTQLPFTSESNVRITPSHTVMGNPNRHDAGSVDLLNDDQWTRSLPLSERLLATLPSVPKLHRFGYSYLRGPR